MHDECISCEQEDQEPEEGIETNLPRGMVEGFGLRRILKNIKRVGGLNITVIGYHLVSLAVFKVTLMGDKNIGSTIGQQAAC